MSTTRRRGFLKFLGWSAGIVLVLLLAALMAGWWLLHRYEMRAAQFDLTKIDEVAERSSVYDANGEFYSYFGGENRFVVPLSAVSKHFINALLAREDARFWEHRGVDLQGVVRAFIANVRAGETKQGGSTITQQLARNACGLRARTLDRKALEAVLARHIERAYTKEQILEFYVNRIFFGAGCYGIEAASREYLGKPASDLTLGEAAMLAGLIRSPNRLAPSRDLDAAVAGRDTVLARMHELGFISGDDLAAATAQKIQLAKARVTRVADDYVMDAVWRELSAILAPETIDYGGLTVFTTIDPQLQRQAREAADRKLMQIEEQKNYPHPRKADFIPETSGDEEKPTDYLQAAVVLIDNRTGAIRALVGGRDYAQSKYSRALLSRRQIGSTFKPFVYAAAFERGLLPMSLIDDSRITPQEFPHLPKNWSPDNSDDQYGGLQPAALGLLKSRNTMTVRVGELAGLSKVRALAKSAGLGPEIPDLPVVFLGGFETTVKDLAASYSIFPNLGIFREPHLISSVEDREGRILWKAPAGERRVISPDSAWMVSSILQQVMKTGTAARSASMGWKKIGAGKTGTTNDFFDAWFVGYTSSLTCGVWVGMDKPQTIFEKAYGSSLALPIWVEVMQNVPENKYPSGPFNPPVPLTKVAVCTVSAAQATAGCAAHKTVAQVELPGTSVPREMCRTHPIPAPPPVVAPPAVQVPAYTLSTTPTPVQSPPPVATTPVQPAPPQPAATHFPQTSASAPSAISYTEGPGRAPSTAYTAPATTRSESDAPQRIYYYRDRAPEYFSSASNRERFTSVGRTDSFPSRSSRSVRSTPAPRAVEVRRAIPVREPSEPHGTAFNRGNGVTEERIVERMANGGTRTTIIRRHTTRKKSD